jgi:predicted alternative tryptophan synthase beta-subunit
MFMRFDTDSTIHYIVDPRLLSSIVEPKTSIFELSTSQHGWLDSPAYQKYLKENGATPS